MSASLAKFSYPKWVSIIAGAALTMLVTPGTAEATAKQILVLDAYGPSMQGNSVFAAGVMRAADEGQEAPEIFWEALESYRFPGEANAVAMRNLLREKYANKKIDVILARSDTALGFFLQFREELFPGVPIVALLSRRPDAGLAAGVTAVWVGPVYKEIAELALRLRPGTRRLIIIDGSLANTGALELEVGEQLSGLSPRVSVDYLRDLPLSMVKARVRAADRATSVLFVRQMIGEPHESLDNLVALEQISRESAAPIYVTTDTAVGSGGIGGYVADLGATGSLLLKTALRIADGEAVERTSNLVLVPMFNARELRRWGIREDRLPPGSVVLFRELTFWDQYKGYVIGAMAVLVGQTALIAGLLLHRVRRRKAERALRESEAALRRSYQQTRHLAGRLISAQEAERKRIARDLHDDLSQKLALLSIGIEQLAPGWVPPATDVSERVRELSRRAGDIARDVHRLSYELHPSKLELLGLVLAVHSICTDASDRSDVRVEFRHGAVGTEIPPDVELCIFRIVQEALNNVVRHSRARRATVRLAASIDMLHLHIADCGIGFDLADQENAGLGLVSMRERVNLFGGRITIRSSHRHGTRMAVHVPLSREPSIVDAPRQAPDDQHLPRVAALANN